MSFVLGFNEGIATLRHRLLRLSDARDLACFCLAMADIQAEVGVAAVGYKGMRENREFVLKYTLNALKKSDYRPLWWEDTSRSFSWVPVLHEGLPGCYVVGGTNPQPRDLWGRETPMELVGYDRTYWVDKQGRHYEVSDVLAVPFGRGIRELESEWSKLPRLNGGKMTALFLLDEHDLLPPKRIIDAPLVELRRYSPDYGRGGVGDFGYQGITVTDSGNQSVSEWYFPEYWDPEEDPADW